METLSETFRAEITDFIERTGMEPTTFGKLACNNPSFVFLVRGGRSCTINTVDKVRKFMAEYPQATAAE